MIFKSRILHPERFAIRPRRSLWQRLRAWLRPYPDDAEMQREMLSQIPLLHQYRKVARSNYRFICHVSERAKKIAEELYGRLQ